MGGRQVRTGKEYGEIYDHHYVEFTYADGTIMNSQCRHIKNCWDEVNEKLVGTKGTVDFGEGSVMGYNGKSILKYDAKNDPNPYQVEHDLLFDAIAKGEYKFDNAAYGATSTMTAILGRMATYSGKMIKWDEALNSKISIMPKEYAWDANPPVLPNEEGFYPIPMPGSTEVI